MQQMTARRRTAVLIAGLLAAATQAQGWEPNPPRPPASIPNAAPVPPPRVVALMPPPFLRSEPTPIPAPIALKPIPIPRPRPAIPVTMPILSHIPLPPLEYDHEYKGKLTVLRETDYVFLRYVCRDDPTAIACSFRTYDSVTGANISCLIMLGPIAHDDPRAMQHEIAHCNGWPGDHPGAHYD